MTPLKVRLREVREATKFGHNTMKALVLYIIVAALAVDLRADDLFEKEVRPLLVAHCYECHSGTKTSGGLSLETRAGWQRGGENGPAIIPNDPDASLLIQAVRHQSLQMPPEGEGRKLSDGEIDALARWIDRGAPDPRNEVARIGGMTREEADSWWAFQPLQATDKQLTAQVVDEFIDAKIGEQLLTANPQADRRTLIRRATYDLTGLPPTAGEVRQFLNDDSEDAFAKVIDRLLASPEYGVKWGRHWLDVVRYADTAGENTDRPLPHAWRYRNWVIDAFNRDLPYHQFVRLQLAGDILGREAAADEYRQGIIATGYLAVARRFGHDIDQDIHLMYEDVIDNVGKTFLGLSIGCARCHDHKFDPVTSQDYYALYGIFGSTRFPFPGCEAKGQPRDNVALLSPAESAVLKHEWQQRNGAAEAEQKRRDETIVAHQKQLRELAAQPPRSLATSIVTEGTSVAFADANNARLDLISLKKGELLRLVVSPNGSHGADSTLVEWDIAEVDGEKRSWNVSQLTPDLLAGNPHVRDDGSAWCFLDVTDGPNFLSDKHATVDQHEELQSWSSGDTPSVFVNRSENPVEVWTTLPPRSFFVHPGVNREVAVAWIAPTDLTVRTQGRVADAHPTGGDGISFRLEHIENANIGAQLLKLGELMLLPTIEIEPIPGPSGAYAVVDSEARDAPLHLRGDPQRLGETVQRRWLSIFGGDAVPKDSGSGREKLAEWIVDHPLSARVMVNRIWQWHFGQGIVATSNDFGSRGSTPSHKQLLEALASDFRRNGYSLKPMHRLIMSTSAYQRSSAIRDDAWQKDPNNQWLTRFSRRRLQAEELRDSLLFVSGELDKTPARQHPFPDETTWNYTQHDPFNAVYQTNRRSVYLMVQRQRRHPFLALFDGADPNASTAARQTTTVPTQALYFLNSPFFHAQGDRVRDRVLELPAEQRMDFATNVLFQRAATNQELAAVHSFIEAYPGSLEEKWAAYLRAMKASNEFLYID
jgi:hypothetical protein